MLASDLVGSINIEMGSNTIPKKDKKKLVHLIRKSIDKDNKVFRDVINLEIVNFRQYYLVHGVYFPSFRFLVTYI